MRLEHVRIAQALGIGVRFDDRIGIVDFLEGEEVVAFRGRHVQRFARLTIRLVGIRQEGDCGIGFVRHFASLFLDYHRHFGGFGDTAVSVGRGGGQLYRRGIAVTVCRAGHNACTLIRVRGSDRRRLVICIGSGDHIFIGRRPSDGGSVLRAGGNQRQILGGCLVDGRNRGIQIELDHGRRIQRLDGDVNACGNAAGLRSRRDCGGSFSDSRDGAVAADGGDGSLRRLPCHIGADGVFRRNRGR